MAKNTDKKIISQKDMVERVKHLLTFTKVYKKFGVFQARRGKVGEVIITIIDGEEETKNTVKSGDVVVKGPAGELYIISNKKFEDRYEVDKDLKDEFQNYKATGMIRADEHQGASYKFMASWDEEMLVNDGDYLATPVTGTKIEEVTEVYRIEKKVFAETYKEVKGIKELFAENKSKMRGKVICGFPGVGKSTFVTELKESGVKILDSDSSTFDKSKFPQNYIDHIKESTEKGITILASSHDVVRNALIKEQIPFLLVYPGTEQLKSEYLERYKKRGSPEAFIKLLDTNFGKWVGECNNLDDPLVTKVPLKAKEFIGSNETIKGIFK